MMEDIKVFLESGFRYFLNILDQLAAYIPQLSFQPAQWPKYIKTKISDFYQGITIANIRAIFRTGLRYGKQIAFGLQSAMFLSEPKIRPFTHLRYKDQEILIIAVPQDVAEQYKKDFDWRNAYTKAKYIGTAQAGHELRLETCTCILQASDSSRPQWSISKGSCWAHTMSHSIHTAQKQPDEPVRPVQSLLKENDRVRLDWAQYLLKNLSFMLFIMSLSLTGMLTVLQFLKKFVDQKTSFIGRMIYSFVLGFFVQARKFFRLISIFSLERMISLLPQRLTQIMQKLHTRIHELSTTTLWPYFMELGAKIFGQPVMQSLELDALGVLSRQFGQLALKSPLLAALIGLMIQGVILVVAMNTGLLVLALLPAPLLIVAEGSALCITALFCLRESWVYLKTLYRRLREQTNDTRLNAAVRQNEEFSVSDTSDNMFVNFTNQLMLQKLNTLIATSVVLKDKADHKTGAPIETCEYSIGQRVWKTLKNCLDSILTGSWIVPLKDWYEASVWHAQFIQKGSKDKAPNTVSGIGYYCDKALMQSLACLKSIQCLSFITHWYRKVYPSMLQDPTELAPLSTAEDVSSVAQPGALGMDKGHTAVLFMDAKAIPSFIKALTKDHAELTPAKSSPAA